MSLEERFEALMKNCEFLKTQNEEKEAQNQYLRKQLESSLKERRKAMRSSSSSRRSGSVRRGKEKEDEPYLGSSTEDESPRFPRRESRPPNNFNDFKVAIPEFEGRLDPDDFLEWIQTVERVFEYKEVPDEQKVKVIALKLRKYASLWWTNLLAKRARQGKGKIRTWEKMKNKLKGRFLPPNYIQANYALLHHLTQGSMSVEEYTREFEKLMIKCDLQEEEEQTIVRYLGGLSPKYSQVVELQAYTTFDDVCLLAHKVETQFKTRAARRDYPRPTPKGPPFNEGSSPLPPKPAPSSNSLPLKNQAPQRNQPPPQTRSNSEPFKPRRCFKCQGLGHIASECPNPRIISLAEWEMSKEEEEREDNLACLKEEEPEEVIEVADEGEMLMIKRVMSGHKEEAEEQRENIFHSRCTVHNKVCSLIIDGGSCANVASSNMVEKLGLHPTVHPHPYKLQWINQGKGLLVNSWCLIPLSIGKSYQDEVWCDIIPMDACHILLGRPWLFDRKVTYDGYLNTYTFLKDGKTITLAPLSPSQIQKRKSPNNQRQTGLILTSVASSVEAPSYALKPVELSQYLEHDPKPNLRTNSFQQGEYDAKGPMVQHPNLQDILRGPENRPKVKKVEQDMISQLPALPGQTFKYKPWIVELVERDPGGITSCSTHPWEAQDLSFPTSPLAANLEIIWSLNKKQTRSCAIPGQIQRTRLWTPIWATKSSPIAMILWGLKLHLAVNTTKAKRLGDDQRLRLEPASQEGGIEETIRNSHASIVGEPPLGQHQRPLDSPRSHQSVATIKEKAQVTTNQATAPPGHTLKPWPGFASNIANDSAGVSACSSHDYLA